VDPSDGEDVPVEIDILQEVKNHRNKNRHWHVWTEVSRQARVAPF
jgi:hypothetical protein